MNNTTIRVTELPIGSWTDDYKKFIEDLIDGVKKGGKKVKKVKRPEPFSMRNTFLMKNVTDGKILWENYKIFT